MQFRNEPTEWRCACVDHSCSLKQMMDKARGSNRRVWDLGVSEAVPDRKKPYCVSYVMTFLSRKGPFAEEIPGSSNAAPHSEVSTG